MRPLSSLSTFLSSSLGVTDVKADYMQNGPTGRDPFLRSTRVYAYNKGYLWKLCKLSYNIYEARRQWDKTTGDWLFQNQMFTIINGGSHLYVNLGEIRLGLLEAKLVDDLFTCGKAAIITDLGQAVN